MTDPEIIDLLERIRNGYSKALNLLNDNLPASAATEELTATRLINNKILELQANEKKRK